MVQCRVHNCMPVHLITILQIYVSSDGQQKQSMAVRRTQRRALTLQLWMPGCKPTEQGRSCTDAVNCRSVKQCLALHRTQRRALILRMWEHGCEPTEQRWNWMLYFNRSSHSPRQQKVGHMPAACVWSLKVLLAFSWEHGLRPYGQAHQAAYGNIHLKLCSLDHLTLYPDVKVMIPNDLGSLPSALEKKLAIKRVVIIVIECI